MTLRFAHYFGSLWLAWSAMMCAPGYALGNPAFERASTSIFRLAAHDSGGRTRHGSGVLVAHETLVTNCHVVRDSWNVLVAMPSAKLRGQLIRANLERDVCLIHVPGLTGTVVAFGSTTTKREGELIHAAGFAKGGALSVTRGHIEGLFTYKGGGRVVQGSAAFSPGKSGGGLFDAQGRLIGILTFKCLAGGPFHFAVPVEWVSALLQDRTTLATIEPQMPFWALKGDAQPAFVRAASLFAAGKCEALSSLAAAWREREPNSPDALFISRRAWRCTAAHKGPVALAN